MGYEARTVGRRSVELKRRLKSDTFVKLHSKELSQMSRHRFTSIKFESKDETKSRAILLLQRVMMTTVSAEKKLSSFRFAVINFYAFDNDYLILIKLFFSVLLFFSLLSACD